MPRQPEGATRERRRFLAVAVALPGLLAGCGGGGGGGSGAGSESRWVAAWAAAPQRESPARTLANQTLRQMMYVSAGGARIRVRVSNLYGSVPLVIDAMRVARGAGGASIDAATSRAVTFSGQERLSLAAGQELWSDGIDLEAPAHTVLAVSTYVAASAAGTTGHRLGRQVNVVGAGNVAGAAAFAAVDTTQSYAWITGIDVWSGAVQKVVVAFGDSLTDGDFSSVGQNTRYPNALSRILRAGVDGASISVVNAGIAANRWLAGDDGNPAGAARLGRDVLGQTGTTHVVFNLGLNDIGMPSMAGDPAGIVSAEQIFAAIAAAADQAKARGLRVFVGTLTPMRGATLAGYYSDAGEGRRLALNASIRQSTRFDGVVDFDLALRDPADAAVLRPAYDAGDHLHPNDAGYEVMAQAAAAVLLR